MISALGATPVAAQAFYQLPFAVTYAPPRRAWPAYLEDGVTEAYLGLVAVGQRACGRSAPTAMQNAAERAAFWRGRGGPPGVAGAGGEHRGMPHPPLLHP